MYREISKLVLYKKIEKDSILLNLSEICAEFYSGNFVREELIDRIYLEINKLLELATEYGFNDNLWHCYLAYILATNENPFSTTSEKKEVSDGTVYTFARNDFKVFKKLFNYDFDVIEKTLEIDCFSIISNYNALEKSERRYNKNVSDKVKELRSLIIKASDEYDMFNIVINFYEKYGVGKFGLNKAFRVVSQDNNVELVPIKNTADVYLDDLIGYEIQKHKLIENTEAFVQGRKANNCLLFGDSGTGKSTSIKAILNEYYPQGLRVVEIFKHQFQDLSEVIAQLKHRNYKFIIYMDDLSFEEFEIEYKYLKAVIEGGMEVKPDNVLIYATSNRRHIIRETWSDRSDVKVDNGMHQSDTMQEKLSLVNRFGVQICYSKPSQKEYYEIVLALADRHSEITLSEEELRLKANQWELSHGGISGRTAEQFVTNLLSQYGGTNRVKGR